MAVLLFFLFTLPSPHAVDTLKRFCLSIAGVHAKDTIAFSSVAFLSVLALLCLFGILPGLAPAAATPIIIVVVVVFGGDDYGKRVDLPSVVVDAELRQLEPLESSTPM